jgi:hypothetical protein
MLCLCFDGRNFEAAKRYPNVLYAGRQTGYFSYDKEESFFICIQHMKEQNQTCCKDLSNGPLFHTSTFSRKAEPPWNRVASFKQGSKPANISRQRVSKKDDSTDLTGFLSAISKRRPPELREARSVKL